MKIIRNIYEGEIIPNGYGIAYVEYNSDRAVLYPIPINVVVALIRRFWFWVRGGAYEGGYDRGYKEGKRIGRKYAFEQYKKQVRKEVSKEVYEKLVEATKGTHINLTQKEEE